MTQSSSTMNLWIQDANGQQQMIRVVQATPTKTLGGTTVVATSPISSPTVKAIFKTPGQEGTQTTAVLPTGAQVLRSLGIQSSKPAGQRSAPHVVTIPVQATGTTPSPLKTATVKGEPAILPKTTFQFSPAPVVMNASHLSAQQQQLANTPPPKNYISPILDHSGFRKRQEMDTDYTLEFKRRKTEKVGKGLRHFSMKVCEKVRKKGTTSYNEVADELVAEFTNPPCVASADQQYDQKNIRRRVYDALNVLMAMNIISKEKKEIRWLGLPTNSLQECQNLERKKQQFTERIKVKTQQLQDLLLQQISCKTLVERNRLNEETQGAPAPNSAIQLPFLIVNTSKNTVIDCSISNDKMEYLFNFNDTFEIHDDVEVLKRMGMALGLENGGCEGSDLQKAKSFVPKNLKKYVEQLSRGQLELPELDRPGPSVASSMSAEDLEVQRAVGGRLSRQSSLTSLISDPLRPDSSSPSNADFSDEDSDTSDDLEVN